MTVRYLIKLEPDDNDTLLVTCRALPEVAIFGEDEADAMRRARDATKLVNKILKDLGLK